MNYKLSITFILVLFTTVTSSIAQTTRRVLFLGNSYTYFNNLPQLVKDAALSAGDSLIFDVNAIGGYTLEDHSYTPASLNKIKAGNWDYVVLQGQSQEPVVQSSTFYSGGNALDDTINKYNPCAVTMLYVTWGRKNGDASTCPFFPQMCTYNSMDSSLKSHYIYLASAIDAELSPVSVVWKYLRQNYPGIELYQADESHPSLAGSYAAACCFYTAIFKHDPTLITYNGGLSALEASIIRNAAKTQVFDHLSDWDYKELPQSNFQYTLGAGPNEVIFSAQSSGISQTYLWNFGDGFSSSSPNPTHTYVADGTYIVTLTTTNCDLQGMHTSTSDTVIQFCGHTSTIYTLDPWLCENDTLWTQPADSYQWYSSGIMIPVTTQYLPDYIQYPGMGFSVVTTIAGCSEMSQTYSANPEWSGYYFDAAMGGDPCEGDTALFVVLHISASLLGTEVIHWYKNGTLLSFANNQDTLFITEEGTYECKVIDPASHCPLDTTTATVVFDCDISGIDDTDNDVKWKVYPNPASEMVIIEFTNSIHSQDILIYDSRGLLIKTVEAYSTTYLNVSEWSAGLYYMRLNNSRQPAFKLMKQ